MKNSHLAKKAKDDYFLPEQSRLLVRNKLTTGQNKGYNLP